MIAHTAIIQRASDRWEVWGAHTVEVDSYTFSRDGPERPIFAQLIGYVPSIGVATALADAWLADPTLHNDPF